MSSDLRLLNVNQFGDLTPPQLTRSESPQIECDIGIFTENLEFRFEDLNTIPCGENLHMRQTADELSIVPSMYSITTKGFRNSKSLSLTLFA